MTNSDLIMSAEDSVNEAKQIFEHLIGAASIAAEIAPVGNSEFLKFVVGQDADYYKYAIHETQRALSSGNRFKGKLSLRIERSNSFPSSLEATALITLLTGSTRTVTQRDTERSYVVPYVPFQNREDHLLAQPATHVVLGRRGVGKSTLIRRATDLLRKSKSFVSVIDMQAYSSLSGDSLAREVIHDVLASVCDDADRVQSLIPDIDLSDTILALRKAIPVSGANAGEAIPRIRRELRELTKKTQSEVYVFLDDFHLVSNDEQSKLLHVVHGILKGANGWLKVAGVRSLLNHYSPKTKEGLQVPGDAQIISLDLTLENPEAAETHLRAILDEFLKAVGYRASNRILPESPFKRLVWANAGVPRDFLQMFGRALEHSRRNKRTSVALSDINVAIGESGQGKMEELRHDAHNVEGALRRILSALETYCLDERKINAFLLRSDECEERRLIHILSDLRLVHLIHQSATPDKAGERYEAYILDYSLFTGFRRRPTITEMTAKDGQFKASELRKLPKIAGGFLSSLEQK